jgi:hypothetical protein
MQQAFSAVMSVNCVAERDRPRLYQRAPVDHAAIDGHDGAGRVGREIRCEQRHGGGDFLDVGGAAVWKSLLEFPPARSVAEAGGRLFRISR